MKNKIISLIVLAFLIAPNVVKAEENDSYLFLDTLLGVGFVDEGEVSYQTIRWCGYPCSRTEDFQINYEDAFTWLISAGSAIYMNETKVGIRVGAFYGGVSGEGDHSAEFVARGGGGFVGFDIGKVFFVDYGIGSMNSNLSVEYSNRRFGIEDDYLTHMVRGGLNIPVSRNAYIGIQGGVFMPEDISNVGFIGVSFGVRL